MTRLPDKIDTILDEIKVTKGGDDTDPVPLTIGSTDNSTRFIQRNNIFLDADATQVLINAPERVYFNLTTSANNDFAVEMSGNFPLRIQSQVINEATCELLWPNYDSYMTINSIPRREYVDDADDLKVTKGGDSTLLVPLVVGSTDNSTQLIQRNNTFLDADAIQVLINAPERVGFVLNTPANNDFVVEMSGNIPFRIQSLVLNEVTCELLWPNYDTYMTNNSVPRREYVDDADSLKVTKGGDTDGVPLVVGTLDSQNVTIVRDNVAKLTATSFSTTLSAPNQVILNSTQNNPQPTNVFIQNGGTAMITCADENLVTIHQPVDMSSNRITNVLDPTAAQDGATRNYVDTRTLDNLSDVVITSVGADDTLVYSAPNWVNLTRSYAMAAWTGNVTSSLGTQNNVNWLQGTFGDSVVKNFTIAANNSFTYTGTATRTFLVNAWAVPIVASNDRTVVLTAWRNPSALLNPTGVNILGSKSVSIIRTSVNDTDDMSCGFWVSLATNDVLRFYVSNSENNDAITVVEFSVRIMAL